MCVRVQFCVSGTALSGCCHDDQVKEDWKQGDPPCICDFAMDRCAADAALRFQPVGAFLVRMCSEPGSFAISCRCSNDPHHMAAGLPGECFPSHSASHCLLTPLMIDFQDAPVRLCPSAPIAQTRSAKPGLL